MPSALDVDKEGDAGDWRMAAVARVAEESGPYKVNDLVRQVQAVEIAPGTVLSFPTPSSVALALNIAEQAARRAVNLKLQIAYQELKAGDSAAFGVTTEAIPTLYDFLEQSMLSAVFSYQAVEAFANSEIARQQKESMEVMFRRKTRTMMLEEIERRFTTTEKLSQILPAIRSVESPRSTPKWDRFKRLEVARNSTVHLKVKDQYAKDKDSLFFQMLSIKTTEFPSAAAEIIRHYFKPDSEPRWLLLFLKKIGDS